MTGAGGFLPWQKNRYEPPPGWEQEGQTLTRELLFHSFEEGMQFLDRLAGEAVYYGRRPDMAISSGPVRLSIRNPNRAGLTLAELRLAEKANAVIEAEHSRP